MPKKRNLSDLYNKLVGMAGNDENFENSIGDFKNFEEYMNSSSKNKNRIVTARLATYIREDPKVLEGLKGVLPEAYKLAKTANNKLAKMAKKSDLQSDNLADALLDAKSGQNYEMVEDAKKAEAAKEKAAKEKAAKAAQKAAERAKKKPAKQVSAREKLLKEAEAKLKEQEKEDKQLSVNADESMQGQLLGRKNQRKMHREALKAISKPSGWGPLTAALNSQSQGTHDDRHGVYYEGEPPVKKQKEFAEVSGTQPETTAVRTEQGMLRGATYTPEGYENNQPQKVVLFFSGSGGPSEEQSANAIQTHLENGAKVVCLNYRGYGKSETLDANGKKKGTSLSEKSLYDDGMAMYEYVTKPKSEGGLGYAPEDVVLHGYSMGGAVASRVAAEVGQMNIARAIAKNEPLEQSNKLGGLIMQSPMPSMKQAATLQSGSFAGLVASSSGGYNSIENTKLARQYDPDLPIHVIGGAKKDYSIKDSKGNVVKNVEADWLNPQISGYMDGIKGLKNVTYAEGKGDHFGKNVANHEKLKDMTTMSRQQIGQKELDRELGREAEQLDGNVL